MRSTRALPAVRAIAGNDHRSEVVDRCGDVQSAGSTAFRSERLDTWVALDAAQGIAQGSEPWARARPVGDHSRLFA
jgi:hypothetical protein